MQAQLSHTATRTTLRSSIEGFAMRHRRLCWIALCALSSFFASLTAPVQAAPAGAPVEALWRLQEFDFHFRAARGHYHSCSSLHSKISGILEAVGAGSVVVKLGCNARDLTDATFARVAAAVPQEATLENIRAATTFDSRQQLTARVNQIELPTQSSVPRFSAEWREVSIAKIPGLHLGPGDCDLLDDLNDQIFPHLSIRVVRERLRCGSSNIRSTPPILVVEALMRRTA
jgi:hypothetical protein